MPMSLSEPDASTALAVAAGGVGATLLDRLLKHYFGRRKESFDQGLALHTQLRTDYALMRQELSEMKVQVAALQLEIDAWRTKYYELLRQNVALSNEIEHIHKSSSLLDLVGVASFESDAKGLCVAVSPSWTALTGIEESEALGMGWVDALDPYEKDAVVAAWLAAVRDGKPFSLNYKYINVLTGVAVKIHCNSLPVLSLSGAVVAHVGLIRVDPPLLRV